MSPGKQSIMNKKPKKFINPNIIIGLILILNLCLGTIYFFAHPEGSFWENVWSYLGSSVFMLVTGSLLIPLLLSFIEKQYKFIENIQRQQEERKKQLEEERRNQRQQAIADTIAMWQDLYNQISEVIYFDLSQDQQKINDLLMRMSNFTSEAEHIVNKWTHQFPNIEPEDIDVFLEFINILYQSGLTTAYYIKNEGDKKEVEILQEMLYLIQSQIKTIANHSIINTLKYAAKALEMKEGEASIDEVAKADRKFNTELDGLKGWAKAISDMSEEYDNFLAPFEGPKIHEVKVLGKKIGLWLKEDKKRFIYQHDHFSEFEKQYNDLPLREKLSNERVPYSKEYMKALAEWLSLESACNYVYTRAHGIW